MNTFIWIGIVILLLGWIGLMIASLCYKFEEDRLDRIQFRSLPKSIPANPSETVTPDN